MRRFGYGMMVSGLMLTGCMGIGGIWLDPGNAPLAQHYPFGARWVKEGMTRESRLADWVGCGGGSNLQDGFREPNLSEPYSSYWPMHENHRYDLWACMRSKGYEYFNKGFEYEYPKLDGKSERCDARCLYP